MPKPTLTTTEISYILSEARTECLKGATAEYQDLPTRLEWCNHEIEIVFEIIRRRMNLRGRAKRK